MAGVPLFEQRFGFTTGINPGKGTDSAKKAP
jgi:hypothetical protein